MKKEIRFLLIGKLLFSFCGHISMAVTAESLVAPNQYPTILRKEKQLLELELSQLIRDLNALEQVSSLLRQQKTENSLATFSLLAASPFLLRSLANLFNSPSMWQQLKLAKKETIAAAFAGVVIIYALDFKYHNQTMQEKLEQQLQHLQFQVSNQLQQVSVKYKIIVEALVKTGDLLARDEYLSQLQISIRNIELLAGVIAATGTNYSGDVFTRRYLFPIFSFFIGPNLVKDLVTDVTWVKSRSLAWAGATAVSVAVVATSFSSLDSYLQADDDQKLLDLLARAKAQLQEQLQKFQLQF